MAVADFAPRLPNSHEAEIGLLSKVLLQPDLWPEIAARIPDPDCFYYRPHQQVWRAMTAVVGQGGTPDFAQVAAWLDGSGEDSRSLWRELLESATAPLDPLALAEQLRELYERRRLISVAGQIQQLACDLRLSLPEIRQSAEELLHKATTTPDLTHLVPLSRVVSESWSDYEARVNGSPAPYVPTGIGSLDEMLGGGLRRGTLTVIMGRPAMGKTAALLTLATQISRQVGIAIFSLEMSRAQLVERLLSRYGIPRHKWLAGLPLNEPEAHRLVSAYQDLERLSAAIDDSSAITLVEIGQKVRRWNRQHPNQQLRVIFIDYLQLLCPGNGPEAIDALSRTTKGLCALAKDLDLAVVLLSQVNRSKESQADKRPTLADARGSGTIEEDSAAVIGLYRAAYYQPDAGPAAEWIVLKNRFGPTGTITLLYDAEKMLFCEPKDPKVVRK